jgi:hypothetical protein
MVELIKYANITPEQMNDSLVVLFILFCTFLIVKIFD